MRNPLGTLIREKRMAAGLTLREVAGTLSLSAPYLSDVESGNRVPIIERWTRFVGAIPGLTLDAFVNAAVLSGPVEIDVSGATPAQRKPIVAALAKAAMAAGSAS
jgi:transcriptional regulator with XRE-family HTH domain